MFESLHFNSLISFMMIILNTRSAFCTPKQDYQNAEEDFNEDVNGGEMNDIYGSIVGKLGDEI